MRDLLRDQAILEGLAAIVFCLPVAEGNGAQLLQRVAGIAHRLDVFLLAPRAPEQAEADGVQVGGIAGVANDDVAAAGDVLEPACCGEAGTFAQDRKGEDTPAVPPIIFSSEMALTVRCDRDRPMCLGGQEAAVQPRL
jgi:hypothetical protein